jgi:hypothetical protein
VDLAEIRQAVILRLSRSFHRISYPAWQRGVNKATAATTNFDGAIATTLPNTDLTEQPPTHLDSIAE